ncbi:MAG: fused MFS/spermidine synthase [Nitrospirae bacterium]|nr:fused MFS/spermidine synthase [Nitrospirota bacterium]
MNNREVLYYIEREPNSVMVTSNGGVVTLWCPLRTKQSEVDLRAPLLPGLEYARKLLCALLFVPAPGRILVIGLGGGTVPTALSAAVPEAAIDVVEIDAEVASIAGKFFNFRQSQRLRLFTCDGAAFVRESRERYDIIIVDAYTGDRISDSIASEEFFAGVARCLREDGVAAVNLMTGNPTMFKRNLRLIRGAFEHLSLLSCKGSSNTVVFAGRKKIPTATLSGNAGLAGPKLPPELCLPELIAQFKGVSLLEIWPYGR